ncbi:MAG: hypothetical protein BWK73_20045 [Thiothrix lacustris]|uniref:Toxin-antitoxin system HicB family antitoxin n=1 Tax=Thiothrix lacustris TaxID=525917 RepID=A0A1Y1QP37_9GAMM|nr:MAG: hypothetical protein BWK73_20045 [Thiothrix lacustris]
MRTNKQAIKLRLEEDMKQRVQAQAEASHMSFNAYVTDILRKLLSGELAQAHYEKGLLHGLTGKVNNL